MAHDDIDQIAASSRLSVHDIKSNSSGPAIESPHLVSHPICNSRMVHSGHPNGGNMKPIILADNSKSHGSSASSNTHYQQQKQNYYDRNLVDVSVYCLTV